MKLKFTLNEDHMEATFNFGNLHISGNDAVGFRPVELLVSSIASCSGLVFHNILKKQRTEIDDLTIEADVERNEKNANRIEKITLHFTVKGSDLNEKKMQRNLTIAKKHCAMVQSVEGSIEVEETLTIIDA